MRACSFPLLTSIATGTNLELSTSVNVALLDCALPIHIRRGMRNDEGELFGGLLVAAADGSLAIQGFSIL